MTKATAVLLASLAIVPLISTMYLPSTQHRVHPRGGLPDKRPFCNAFTGCGRKRSQLPPLTGVQELGAPLDDGATDENLGTLLDLSAEPAVEDLSRQIMSEAKLWEAIQEANMEIMRQKQEQLSDEPPQKQRNLVVSNGNTKCALPSCIAL